MKDLELIVLGTEGSAIFEDSNGQRYFREDGHSKPLKPIIPFIDKNPLLTESFEENMLSEPGRKFSSLEEAQRYADTLVNYHTMLYFAAETLRGNTPPDKRIMAREGFRKYQVKILEEGMEVLDTIKEFDDRQRAYLHMTPEQIIADLEK